MQTAEIRECQTGLLSSIKSANSYLFVCHEQDGDVFGDRLVKEILQDGWIFLKPLLSRGWIHHPDNNVDIFYKLLPIFSA